MNSDPHLKSSANQLSEDASELSHEAADTVNSLAGNVEDVFEDVGDSSLSATQCAAAKTKEIYELAKLKAEESIETSKAYVRRNPLPVVMGAIAFGATLGYLLLVARRKPTFSERYAEEPMGAVRDALFGVIAPVTHRVHRGYDSARDGAGRVMGRVHNFGSVRCRNSISDQIGRIGNNLKFW